MYTINFDPVAVSLGFFEVRWYSLFYMSGFLFLYLVLMYVVKNKLIENFTRSRVDDFLVYTMLGVILGGRLFHFVFYNFSDLFSLELFKLWQGGMSFHGGLIGVMLTTFLFTKKYKIKLWKVFDVLAFIAMFGLMIGRIGNFINGELAGTIFNGVWCTVFPAFDNVCRHPYPVYAFISHLLLFSFLGLIVYINRKQLHNLIGNKKLSIYFLIGYGVTRIIVDIWKVDQTYLFLKTGQWLSVVMIIIGFILYRKK